MSDDSAGDKWVIDLRDGPMQGQVFRWISTDGVLPFGRGEDASLGQLVASHLSLDPAR